MSFGKSSDEFHLRRDQAGRFCREGRRRGNALLVAPVRHARNWDGGDPIQEADK